MGKIISVLLAFPWGSHWLVDSGWGVGRQERKVEGKLLTIMWLLSSLSISFFPFPHTPWIPLLFLSDSGFLYIITFSFLWWTYPATCLWATIVGRIHEEISDYRRSKTLTYVTYENNRFKFLIEPLVFIEIACQCLEDLASTLDKVRLLTLHWKTVVRLWMKKAVDRA